MLCNNQYPLFPESILELSLKSKPVRIFIRFLWDRNPLNVLYRIVFFFFYKNIFYNKLQTSISSFIFKISSFFRPKKVYDFSLRFVKMCVFSLWRNRAPSFLENIVLDCFKTSTFDLFLTLYDDSYNTILESFNNAFALLKALPYKLVFLIFLRVA